jgi:Amt family ammonium transporter
MFTMRANGSPKIFINTLLSSASAGIISFIIKPHIMGTYSRTSKYDVCAICNGIMAGLLAITGACDCVDNWAAFVIGIIGALFYIMICKLEYKFNIDDPVEASCVNLTGIWGILAVGIFHNE